MRPIPLAGWAVLSALAFVATLALLIGAFTRFDGGEAPARGDPGLAAYEDEQYDRARLTTFLGLGAAFMFLGGAACAQKAVRILQMKRQIHQT